MPRFKKPPKNGQSLWDPYVATRVLTFVTATRSGYPQRAGMGVRLFTLSFRLGKPVATNRLAVRAVYFLAVNRRLELVNY